ncbi:hypothetical protein Gogos_003759 [Gossypium gossypioides]|uniref:Retrotransposon gag domain-containing protein n=1 Tax=Gossypium gossypioides TaxID=34282 RepID=A0A7J9CN37_GOSGO|nr:hypothetical protein [Gossypium gossypioides]
MWARKSLREMLSAVEERMSKLEEYGGSKRRDSVQELLDSQRKKLTERNDVLEAMVKVLKEEIMATTMTLSIRIEELEGELTLCRAADKVCIRCGQFFVENGKLFLSKGITDDTVKVNTTSMFIIDIALLWWRDRTTDKMQWITQWGTVGEYVREFMKFMLQVSDVAEKEALLAFQNGLKPWVR